MAAVWANGGLAPVPEGRDRPLARDRAGIGAVAHMGRGLEPGELRPSRWPEFHGDAPGTQRALAALVRTGPRRGGSGRTVGAPSRLGGQAGLAGGSCGPGAESLVSVGPGTAGAGLGGRDRSR